ncbi:MAG: beta-carotene ketolase, partial [Calditrichaeota bacterium]|nr:beta-carotene ketolase [Calditrichota bacterium]
MKFSKIDAYKGLGIALLMIMAWGGSLGIFLNLDVANLHPAGIVLAMLWQTFLYTGLFITAHDAMHGTLFPLNRKINNF